MNIVLKDSTAAIVKCNFQFDNRLKCAPDPEKKPTFHQGSLLNIMQLEKKSITLLELVIFYDALPLHKQFKYPVILCMLDFHKSVSRTYDVQILKLPVCYT